MSSTGLYVPPVDGGDDLVPREAYERTRIQYCRVCAFPMPWMAAKCTKCDSWTKRRWLTMTQTTLSLLIALFSVLSTLAPQLTKLFSRNSETSISIVSAEKDDLVIAATNSGGRSSAVRDATIEFLDNPLAIPRQNLVVFNGSHFVTPSAADSSITLRGDTFPLAPAQEKALDAWIEHGKVELIVNVQESTDDPESPTQRKDLVCAKNVKAWIKGQVNWKKVRS